jgi:Mg2+-importing ATPase
MSLIPVGCATAGIVLPFTPLADVLGFTALPWDFFLILLVMIAMYVVLIEGAKSYFYKKFPMPQYAQLSHAQRHHRRVRRSAHRFVRHVHR